MADPKVCSKCGGKKTKTSALCLRCNNRYVQGSPVQDRNLEMLAGHRAGTPVKDQAAKYGISTERVRQIVNRELSRERRAARERS